ncbi:MAG: ABC transporter permease, partial [Planctomycetota bacterium]|nr:ABC transporter permease [Planctomycetota bacterium]
MKGIPQNTMRLIAERPPAERSWETMSQAQLIKLRFSKHKLAVIGLFMLAVLYFVATFAEFFAPSTRESRDLDHSYCPPQVVQFSVSRGFYVHEMTRYVDPITFRKTYMLHKENVIPLGFFVRGEPYELWGFIPMERHFFGVKAAGDRQPIPQQPGIGASPPRPTFYLLGADKYGRDVLTRMIYGARISLSVGLIGIACTFLLGITIGGISGYLGGWADVLIQRLIEIFNSLPHLPLWLALAAVLPGDWSPLRIYFAITILLSLLGWTGLARVVRGKILALREEDYAMAARLLGASHARVLFRHLLPGFTSHISVTLTLRVPGMILGETSLSFRGLGL